MASDQLPREHRFCLPPGTVVKDWRLEGCHGHGAHGVVYRAVRVGQESAGPVALKMALYPWDPRFMREVALLSLIHHPSIPRLYGHGFWKHPAGMVLPFVVMEWVEGTPLYEWAREQHPTSPRLFQVLAQLARALEATHEASAVHRDVKGDNVLVRRSDGRAMLTDFGAGNYPVAARVTWQPLPPGTPAYQSPESGLFQIRSVRSPGDRYMAGPADDVFALGVTAYRLVTGEYPPSPEPWMDENDSWHMKDAGVRPPSELNPQVDPRLSALILRMLSLEPGARGTARELAEALESSTQEPVRGRQEAPPEPQVSAEVRAPMKRSRSRARVRAAVAEGALTLVLTFTGVSLALWTWQALHVLPGEAASQGQVASGAGGPDTGLTHLGAAASGSQQASEPVSSERKAISQGQPPKPVPGQVRPDARGQCPGRKQVSINGGCWVEVPGVEPGECTQNGLVLIKNRCYARAQESRPNPPPTADQQQ